MASSNKLYTPDVLALATALARWPLTDDLPLRASARSRTCGSALELGLAVEHETIVRAGIRAQACAIGQASAAIFAEHCIGQSAATVAAAERAVRAWLSGERDLPHWPGFAAIAAARDVPGRHGAILLPWDAARELLPTR